MFSETNFVLLNTLEKLNFEKKNVSVKLFFYICPLEKLDLFFILFLLYTLVGYTLIVKRIKSFYKNLLFKDVSIVEKLP